MLYRRAVLSPVALVAAAGLVASASAQTWNQTAGGAWTTATNWTPGTVPNVIGATAVFNSTAAAQAVTLASGVTIGSLTFDNTALASNFGYTISGSTITLNNGGGGSPAVFTVSGGANANTTNVISSGLTFAAATPWNIVNNGNVGVTTLSFTGTLTGAGTGVAATPVVVDGAANTSIGAMSATFGTLTKNGTGTLFLTGGASNNFGNTTVNAGTLNVTTGPTSLGAIASVVTLAGGRLQLSSGTTSFSRAVTLTANSGIDVQGATTDFNFSTGVFTFNANTLTKTGNGQLTLGGTSTSSAGAAVNVNEGILSLASAAAVGGANTTINLGDTSGSANSQLLVATAATIASPIVSRAGSSGTRTISA